MILIKYIQYISNIIFWVYRAEIHAIDPNFWIQLTINNRKGPSIVDNFGNLSNLQGIVIGQDTCCGSDNFNFIGTLQNIILYEGTENSERYTLTTQTNRDISKDFAEGLPASLSIGLSSIIVILGTLYYFQYSLNVEKRELALSIHHVLFVNI